MAANKNVAPAAALLVLLALTMLSSMALAARHPPVTESHLHLIPPYFDGPVARAPHPPATATVRAEDDDDVSPQRKVPRGPNHSPNDPSPPPPSAVADAGRR
ncbi:hypothetical protein HU200_020239 [Digitaria exilis]|uniref:Uncharacterized protein n=1 Tax=Digitaria exilis TaxID=1010633 RepID=A0A835KH08_9POAL|nr:hypothetical protein HU200_020239 [Digitaria exilis]CAB3463708.1 unnamed protein product [Digitaria exilis]